MRIKLLMALTLALVMAIVALAGCGGTSVEAARAGAPRVPAPHVPHPEPRPPVDLPRPPRVHIPPEESFEVLKQQRVRQFERRYAAWSALIPYACLAKDLVDASKAETVDEAVRKAFISLGGDFTFVPRVVGLVGDMEEQSSIDRISELAMFTFCETQ
jgi:hypothetical protein